ncbi:MAG: HAD family hydrolase [Bacilli bacterium]|nr:HAD family hydrolase [Bacilli bacterium]
MIKGVIFDMDGTLVDTDLMIVLSWKKVFEKFRPEYKPSIRELLDCSGPPLREFIPKVFPNAPYEEVKGYFLSLCPKYYNETVIAVSGVKEVLKELKEKGYKLAICTSKYRFESNMTLKLTGLEGIFDCMVCGDEVKNAKPNPEPLEKCLEQMSISNDEALYVGDTYYDVLAAKNAKMDFVLCDYGPRHLPKGVEAKKRIMSWSEFMEVSGL